MDQVAVLGRAARTARPAQRPPFPEEAGSLAQGGLVDVGAHTLTHPCLAALPAAAQRDEIGRGKVRLEGVLGRPVSEFAYPYGRLCDYTRETVGLVKEAGFSLACS